MPSSITTSIKSFMPQRTVNRSPSGGNRVVLKTIPDYSTSSASINMLEYFSPVSNPYLSIYDDYEYIGKLTPYISTVYTRLKSIRSQVIQGNQDTMTLQTLVTCVGILNTPLINVISFKT